MPGSARTSLEVEKISILSSSKGIKAIVTNESVSEETGIVVNVMKEFEDENVQKYIADERQRSMGNRELRVPRWRVREVVKGGRD